MVKLAMKTLQQLLRKKKKLSWTKNKIRVIKSQRSDIGKNKMIEDGKMIDIDEIIKQKQIINNIKSKYKNNVMILLKV